MFSTQTNGSGADAYEREKIRILQALNVQVQSMAMKLDQIVNQVEETLLKIKPNSNAFKTTPTLITITNADDTNNNNNTQFKSINTINADNLTQQIQLQPNTNLTNTIVLSSNSIELANNHQLVKIIDEPPNDETTKAQRGVNRKSRLSVQSNSSSATTLKSPNNNHLLNESKLTIVSAAVVNNKPPDTTAKRNKQQRQFNTFVRESINQLLGPDFMRTHDVQDIDAQVMEMIRKEAVENYLPENIRPRRAWHLAKASLRTLKRTLNNKK